MMMQLNKSDTYMTEPTPKGSKVINIPDTGTTEILTRTCKPLMEFRTQFSTPEEHNKIIPEDNVLK